ncbi:tRNA lysidine(34) synthetase TilS [Rhodoplanes sp. Z2-YC6860]|uniref:tRNA lysidine(34) synthetase TilS n=1 Tax=Rhodoplanes sp. Z2-YC6860 TaxID=674703 RepID=UPI00078BE1D1|nr:tRNA lysidine(34) synthetase TilS [Rhodoplanes sp. Z2-YC6860]AMN40332.1 tRNA(Ile)-lysidine synthase [Rhodoplanes sp. Z2-YC6860]
MSSADGLKPITDAEVRALFAHLVDFPSLILAVSGGPDSTALMVLAARWRQRLRRGPKLVAVTVDHGLRPEAKREALAVKRLARSLRIEHKTLRWIGTKPKSGIQEAARAARYRLLGGVALKADKAPVLTAHTQDDQAETVLFRMMRGSGVAGLAAMRAGNPLPGHEDQKLALFRPLLGVSKSRLTATLRAAKISYADDPSNRDPRFARPRLRELMPQLAAEGLTSERLARLASRVSRVEWTLYEVLNAALLKFAPGPWPAKGPITLNADEFSRLPEEIALRMLERIINWVGNEGPAELGKLENLFEALAVAMVTHPRRFRRTLAGAVVTMAKDRIIVELAPARRAGLSRPALNRSALKRP